MADSIFTKIIRGEIPANKVYEDARVVAFHDVSPQAPVHILIVPVEPVPSVDALETRHETLVGYMILTAGNIARDLGLAENGYRLVFNCGKDGGQSVDHLHLHLLGGREMAWPPG